MIKFDVLTSDKNCIGEGILKYEKQANKLPDELDYIEIENGIAVAYPNKEVEFKFKGKIDKDIEEKIGRDITKIHEYMYNSQKPLPVIDICINNNVIPKEMMVIAPFKDLKFQDLLLVPKKFSKDDFWEADIHIAKKKFKVKFIRSAYDGIGVKRYSTNVNNKFNISLEFHDDNRLNCKINFNINGIKTITDILEIGEYLDNIQTLKVNEFKLGSKIDKFDTRLRDVVDFWRKVKEIGKVLKKRFAYRDEISKNEFNTVSNLYKSLCENKFFTGENEVESLSFKSMPFGYDSLPMNTEVCLIAVGESEIELLGRKINIFIEFIFVDYKFGEVDDIQGKAEYKVKVERTERSIILERYFINESDRNKFHTEITNGTVELNRIIHSFI